MSLHVASLPGVAGPALEQFWLPERVSQRGVSCVSVLRELPEAAECRGGELVIVAPGGSAVHELTALLETLTTRQAAGLLLPAGAFAPARLRQLRAQAARRELPLGLIAVGTDPRALANALARAIGATPIELTLSTLHGADALQTLAETLGRLVGNSVTIETPQHRLLAFSAMHGAVDRVREETILRRQGDSRALAWLVREGHYAEVLKADRPIRTPENPALGFSGRVAMRVAADDEVLAVIWVTDTARPLDERDTAVIAQAAETAAAILLQQRASAQKEDELRTELIEEVVYGRIAGVENIRALARDLGWRVDRLRHLFIVAIDDLETVRLRHAGQSGRRLQRVRERLTEVVRLETLAIDPDAVIGPRSSGVIVLLATNEADDAARKGSVMRLGERIVKRVAALIPGMTVTLGVGRDYASFAELPDSFRQAELAAQLGVALWGGNRAVHYSDLGVHRVLFALREQDEMITPALQRLIDHDARHHSDYVSTLAAYLVCMGRLRQTAARLNVHRNTLEYRLQRIEKLTGESLDDPNNRLALELGIRLLDLQRRVEVAR